MRNLTKAFIAGAALLATIATSASAQQAPAAAKPDSPAKTTLYQAAAALGLVRTVNRVLDLVNVIEYTASGTADDQKVNRITVGIDYVIPAIRHDVETADGKRSITVASDKLTWDESKPGVYSGPGATSAADRLMKIWLLPTGVILAASKVQDQVTLATNSGVRELTIPLPQYGTQLKAQLDAKNFISHVEMTVAGHVYSGDYGNYKQDFEEHSVMFPSKFTQSVDGKVTTDLTLGNLPGKFTAAGGMNFFANPYVIFPVPKEVAAK